MICLHPLTLFMVMKFNERNTEPLPTYLHISDAYKGQVKERIARQRLIKWICNSDWQHAGQYNTIKPNTKPAEKANPIYL